ncbi:MAG: hypothetical protein ACE5JQ_12025 [Candidatus Methylomirabilales bacterium]
MGRILLDVPKEVYTALQAHLLPADSETEEAAFVFAHGAMDEGETVFRYAEWLAITPEGFVQRSEGYLELTDETRARVIKRAHDLGASIAEFHSHPFPGRAAFSLSDRAGLTEFVPHALWRLKGRPYIAVVVAPTSFDGLVWSPDAKTPRRLDGIMVGGRVLRPTGLTLRRWRLIDEQRPL